MFSSRRLTLSTLLVLAMTAGPALAATIVELEAALTASNNTLATAEVIPGAAFTLPVPATVFNPPGFRTATVTGLGGSTDVDFFAFSASGGQAYFDIDNDPFIFDTVLTLFDSNGTVIAYDDDSFPEDPGTSFGFDSFLGVFTLPGPGTYYIAVSQFANFANGTLAGSSFPSLTRPDGAFGGNAVIGATLGDSSFGSNGAQPRAGSPYTLHVSVENPVPEPASMTLLGLGLAGLAARRLRRKKS